MVTRGKRNDSYQRRATVDPYYYHKNSKLHRSHVDSKSQYSQSKRLSSKHNAATSSQEQHNNHSSSLMMHEKRRGKNNNQHQQRSRHAKLNQAPSKAEE